MKHIFTVGEKAIGGPVLPEGYRGMPLTVKAKLAPRTAVWDDGSEATKECYEVEFDHEKGTTKFIIKTAVALPLPKRGDLDEKAGWGMLPLAVVNAMKGGK